MKHIKKPSNFIISEKTTSAEQADGRLSDDNIVGSCNQDRHNLLKQFAFEYIDEKPDDQRRTCRPTPNTISPPSDRYNIAILIITVV